MILQLLTGIHNLTTLLFGIFISAFFLGVKPIMKNFGKLLLFALVDVFFYWGINLFTGTAFANQLYPVLVHLPLILFLFLCYRYSLLSCCISVFSAYLCCQFSNWIGLSALTLTKNPVWYYSSRIAMTFITFFFLFKFVRRTTQTIFSKENKELVIIGFLPFIYYIFDYVTSIYTSLLYSGLEIVGEFLGFVLCLTYLMFLFLYFKEYEANKEAEQRNQIIEMKRVQSEKELEALHRSERAVSILRHDMRHFLLSISSYIENNENEKALDYINEVIHTSDKTALQRYCKNNIINLILSSHEDEMKKKQITFQYTIQIPEKLRISDVDLTALLSNGLENAIHAVSDLPMPKRIIKLAMHMNHDKLLISLKNTYAIKPQIIDGLPYTSEVGHGFGTKSIWYVAEKQNGNCQFMVDDRFFTMRIIL